MPDDKSYDANVQLDNVWLIGGLGSRGLLYHALLSQLVIQEATSRTTSSEGSDLQ